ncbi:MAG: general secretion pathway protein GspD [Planctomycetota bacterium]|nr:general secretion pathway protein GspD [Planctomycetota bacterium]
MNSRKTSQRSRFLLALAMGSVTPWVYTPRLNAQGQLPPANQSFQLPAPNGMQNPQPPALATQKTGNVEARLQVYDVPLEHVGAVGAQLQMQFGADKRVRITNEPNSGRLMVLAPEGTQRQIAQVVDSVRKQVGSIVMDARGNVVQSVVQQNQYKLQRITWRELEDAVGRLAGPRLTVTTLNNGELAQLKLVNKDSVQEVMMVDRRNDIVRLQGTPTMVMGWTQVVTAIDFGQADPNRPTQIIPINPATPERIERALSLVKLATYQKPVEEDEATTTVTRPVPQTGDNERATIIGSPDALSSGSGLIGDVDISFVPEMGLVIIKGSKKDVQRVNDVIEQIKKQSVETQPDIELKMLKHVNSQALETIVKALNTAVFEPRQGQISITALGQPNALLLIGRPEALKGIVDLIDKLDQPLDPNSQPRVFRLTHTSAVDAAALVTSIFTETAPATGGAAGTATTTLAPRVRVVADFRTNSLIVVASPRDQAEVARVIKEIDVDEGPAAESEVKIIPVKNAVASDLEPILRTAITGEASTTTTTGGQQGGGGNTQRPSTSGSSSSSIPNSKLTLIRDGRSVNSGILSGVVVTSNPSVNALIVRAPSKSMALIEALIKQLDVPASVDARIKVFEVKNGDATSLATTLQQAFGLPTTANQNTANNGLGGIFAIANQAALSGSGDSSLVPLRIATENRTNSIIVSGSQQDLDVIEVLLLRLDEDSTRQRIVEVVWLRNSQATDVANAVTNLITNQRSALAQIVAPVGAGGQGAAGQIFSVNERIEREVFVVAEANTNSLIISAMPRFMPTVRQIVERLDRQQPMIAVEILIAEVTLDDNFDLGFEWGLQDSLIFDRNTATGGTLSTPGFNPLTALTTNNTLTPNRRTQNVAGQGQSNFGVSRTNAGLGYGGLVLAASSESVNMLFRALQDVNRVQILSRPQLMTIDNNIATVKVGSLVPRLGGSVLTATGAAQQNIQDADVGLIMQIQPRTNQDGLINMLVAVNRSAVGPVDTGIPVGSDATGAIIKSPIISQTLAQTRVTAYDGQTVVLGGLITKNRSTRSRRIPWLADIPIAGALFRFDSQTENRTELLVVMTPRVIFYNNEEKLEMIKQVESSRMSYCLSDILNIHGDVGLSPGNGLWGPAASPIIYPDLQPTVESERNGERFGEPNGGRYGERYGEPNGGRYGEPNGERYGEPGSMILGEPERMNVPPQAEMLDGYPTNAPVRSDSSNGRTLINSATGGGAQPTVNPASPIQNSSYQPSQQPGTTSQQPGYNGVAPASYKPLSQPASRGANGR